MGIDGPGYYGAGVELPHRAASLMDRKRLIDMDREGSRGDCPTELPVAEIVEEYNLFQPRGESIGLAPGRSEAHVALLAKTAKRGEPLDPVSIVSFGDQWCLVDGYHRLAAYKQVEWPKKVPVTVLTSDLTGDERINWVIEQSYADNKKNRLPLSDGDKSDGAWRAVARGDKLSVAQTASTYNVGTRTVASMRETKKKLEALGCPNTLMVRQGWKAAKRELTDRQDNYEGPTSDWNEHQMRKAAKRLKPVMDMRLSAAQLAEALEAYSPNIVMEMAHAMSREEDSDD